jgi:hypothetical protein
VPMPQGSGFRFWLAPDLVWNQRLGRLLDGKRNRYTRCEISSLTRNGPQLRYSTSLYPQQQWEPAQRCTALRR